MEEFKQNIEQSFIDKINAEKNAAENQNQNEDFKKNTTSHLKIVLGV